VILICCIALIIIGAILGATGVLGGLFGSKQATAQVMPADTGFFTSIDPSTLNSEGFAHLADAYEDAIKDAEVEEALEDAEDELGITFEDDVRPWLGSEVSIGIPNLGKAAEGDDPIVVLAAVTRDRKASDAFLEKLRESFEDEGYDVDEETYNGVTFYEQQVDDEYETPTVFGTVGNVVVVTTGVDAMEDVIDTQQGKSDSLAKNPKHADLRQALPNNASMYMFFNIEDIAPVVEETEAGVSEEQLEGYENVGMAVTVGTQGIQIDAAVTFDPTSLKSDTLDSMKAQSKANSGKILQEIPSDAIGFISSRDLASTWQIALNTIEEDPDTKEQLEYMAEAFGLDIDADLLAWATGEYALAVVKARGESPVGLFATFEVEDESAAKDTMDDIADAIEEQGGDFDSETIEGVDMQIMSDPYGEVWLGYGFTDNHLVIGFTEDGIEQGVGDIAPITDDDTFKAVQSHLPSPNTGYFYVNIDRTLDLIPSEALGSDEGFAFLEPIKAIGGASAVTNPDDGIGKGTVFIYIP
jgi:hypothetical protein